MMRGTKRAILLLGVFVLIGSCEKSENMNTDVDMQGHTAPSTITREINQSVREDLPIDDQQDFDEAKRGLIATEESLQVTGADGEVIWNQDAYRFEKGEAPGSVNPSLWRQAKLNNIHGLFEVTKGIYQLRGYDLANITLIEGKTGWIVVDPLTTKETALRALQFAEKHLGKKPISAIIFTHSHVDHFGGATAMISADEAVSRNIPIIAPIGFMEEAVSENVMAFSTMSRRSLFMYGKRLARSERGHVGTGLGKEPALGTVSILKPTELITRTPQEKVLDGVRFIFQNVPGSEAPAELTFYLPDYKTFCGAEIVSRTMHNLYTLRGAKVRDALKWSHYINEAIELFGDAEVYFGVHHWPAWGNKRILELLKKQRDIYKYIHDQTMRMANSGLTPREIAEEIKFPESLRTTFSNRGYYGTLRHNARAVYQHYIGWYDGNPANLNPLPPEQSAIRYIEYMGGAEKVLQKAVVSFEKGDYRWVAEVLNHLVFADPHNSDAKKLLAKAYDQLGYQSESGPWRDEYLTAAFELRHGAPEKGIDVGNGLEMLQHTPMDTFLKAMAVRLDGPGADGKDIMINLVFTDIKESYVLHLENAVLHHRRGAPDTNANATVELTHSLYLKLVIGKIGIKDLLTSDDIQYKGSKIDLIRFFSLFDFSNGGNFNIVTP